MKRRRAREYALQILFQIEFIDGPPDINAFFSDKNEPPDVVKFTGRIVRGTLKHIEQIDAALTDAAEHWSLGRMAAVDRNVLRAATFEIMFCADVPPAVVMDEAIEVAKKFSGTESAAFINGILDKVARQQKKK